MRVLLAVLLLVPSVAAHVPSTPIEAEDHWIQDEWTDNGLWDGFDILDVHVREAHLPAGDGIVVRWGLYGGSSGGYVTDHHVELSFDNAQTLSWTSSDNGQTWQGPGEILAVSFEAEGDLPVVNVQFQGFVSYETLGVDVGGSLDGAFAAAYAGDMLVDEAPGTYHLYGAPVTDPTAAPESMRLIDALFLDGPDRYTSSTPAVWDDNFTVTVDNLITATGQHILLLTNATDIAHTADGAWVPGAAFEAEPGNGTVFMARFPPDVDVLQVQVRSDLGGLETFWVGRDGTVSETPFSIDPEPVVEESPVPVALVFAALAAGLVARRR